MVADGIGRIGAGTGTGNCGGAAGGNAHADGGRDGVDVRICSSGYANCPGAVDHGAVDTGQQDAADAVSALVKAMDRENAAVLLAATEAAAETISALMAELSVAVSATGPVALMLLLLLILASSLLLSTLFATTPDTAAEPAKLLLPATDMPTASDNASILLSADADTWTPPAWALTLD